MRRTNLSIIQGHIVLIRSVHNQPPRRSAGFSLVELLVVMAMTALVLGLLVPALQAARRKVATVQCLSHLRSLGTVVWMFANEHQGSLPQVTDFNQVPLQVRSQLEPYTGQAKVFGCPGDPDRPRPQGGSYDWRYTQDPRLSLGKVRLDRIRCPSSVAIGGDRNPGWHRVGAINLLFADLHVDRLGEADWFTGIRSPIRR